MSAGLCLLQKLQEKIIPPFLASGSSWHFLASGRSLHSAPRDHTAFPVLLHVSDPLPPLHDAICDCDWSLTWIIQDNLPILRFLITFAKSLFTIKGTFTGSEMRICEYLLGGRRLPSQRGFSSHAVMRVHRLGGEWRQHRARAQALVLGGAQVWSLALPLTVWLKQVT